MKGLSRSRANPVDTDVEGTWAVSYGDMITLLLTFFILFFNANRNAQDQDRKLRESLVLRLNTELAPKPDRKPASLQVGTEDGKGIETAVETRWGAVIHKIGEKVVVEFPGISFYDFTRTELTEDGKTELSRFTRAFLPFGGNYQVTVRAYTDDKPVRAGAHPAYQDNIELSMLRALSALRYLQHAGIPLRLLKTGGFGVLKLAKSAPRGAAGNPLARKVILVIEPGEREEL